MNGFDDVWKLEIEHYVDTVKKRKGQALEYYVAKELEGILGNRVKVLNMDELSILKPGNTGKDIEVEIDGKPFAFEVKETIDAIMGSVAGRKKILKEFGGEIAQEMFDLADQTTKELKDFLDKQKLPYTLEEGTGYVITDKFHPTEKDANGNPLRMSSFLRGKVNRTKTKTLPTAGPISRNYFHNKGIDLFHFGDKGWVTTEKNTFLGKKCLVYMIGD